MREMSPAMSHLLAEAVQGNYDGKLSLINWLDNTDEQPELETVEEIPETIREQLGLKVGDERGRE